MVKKLPGNSAFTLIELLVTISLIGILFTVGIASYIDFSRSQTVTQAARQIVEDLRMAQSLAANNQKPQAPSQCGTLDSYTFKLDSENRYTIDPDCSNPAYDGESIKKAFVLPPPTLELSGFTQVKFKILRQTLECVPPPVVPSTDCKLTVTGFGKTKKVIVGSGGAINLEGE